MTRYLFIKCRSNFALLNGNFGFKVKSEKERATIFLRIQSDLCEQNTSTYALYTPEYLNRVIIEWV